MEYRYGSHSVFNIEYHFVWVTKYHYKVLTDAVSLRVRELVRQTCELFEIQIISGVVSSDHVHLFISALPTMAPSEIMRRIKGRFSSKRFWGRHFWARGYVCASSGNVTDEMIETYLEHHFEPKKKDNFRTES